MPRFRMTVEYDGSAYVGWQRQDNGHSIQAALEKHRQLMAQPSSVARHALDISRLAAFARSRHDPVDGEPSAARGWMAWAEPAPLAVSGRLWSRRSGMRWLRRLLRHT